MKLHGGSGRRRRGQQRGRLLTGDSRGAGCRQIVQHIATLLPQRGHLSPRGYRDHSAASARPLHSSLTVKVSAVAACALFLALALVRDLSSPIVAAQLREATPDTTPVEGSNLYLCLAGPMRL